MPFDVEQQGIGASYVVVRVRIGLGTPCEDEMMAVGISAAAVVAAVVVDVLLDIDVSCVVGVVVGVAVLAAAEVVALHNTVAAVVRIETLDAVQVDMVLAGVVVLGVVVAPMQAYACYRPASKAYDQTCSCLHLLEPLIQRTDRLLIGQSACTVALPLQGSSQDPLQDRATHHHHHHHKAVVVVVVVFFAVVVGLVGSGQPQGRVRDLVVVEVVV